MSQLSQKNDSKHKSKEHDYKIDRLLAQDFKKDLNTPKKDQQGLLLSNIVPSSKHNERGSFTLAQIIQKSKKEHNTQSAMNETKGSKFFMYGNNLVQSKSKERILSGSSAHSKDLKQSQGLKTSLIKPPKNSQVSLADKFAKRATTILSKDVQTPTDRSHSKGPPVTNDNSEQSKLLIVRPPKRRQTDIMDSSSKISHGYSRATTKEESKNFDYGYNLNHSEKLSKIASSSKLTKAREQSPSNYYQRSELASTNNKSKLKPKEDILILFDHDLAFIKPELAKMISIPYLEEKLEDFDTNNPELAKNAIKLMKAKKIVVFLKFSPRVREKSLKILGDLVELKSKIITEKSNVIETCIVKCIPDNEDVDTYLKFENLTPEEKKDIEHTFVLTKESFDSYSLDAEHLFGLKTFLLSRLAV